MIRRVDSLEKTPIPGKSEGRRRWWEDEMDGITDSMDMSLRKLWEMLKDREACCAALCGATKSRTWLRDWTTQQFKENNQFKIKFIQHLKKNSIWWDSYLTLGFPCSSNGKESTFNAGDWVQSLGWEDPLEKGKSTHSSILAKKIPWTVHGVIKSWTQVSDFHFHFHI